MKGCSTVTNPNVIRRHARNAIGLLADGVGANIAEDMDRVIAIDAMADRLADIALPTWINRADAIIADMQAMLGDTDCPNVIRELLNKHDMNP